MYIEYLEGKKHPSKNADISDTHEFFNDAGYVLSDNDLIVDIDNLPIEAIEKMIEIFNIKTQIVWTTRGVHLYFKKPLAFRGSRKVVPLGFEVEYKHSKNTRSITIKQGGSLRRIENEGVREDIPEFLYSNKRLDDLLSMSEGEGRNQALFKHRMKIGDMQQFKSILRFINNHIFEEPLPESEFQTIIRDVKIEAEKDNEPMIAEFLMNKYKMVLYMERIYFWYENEYITDEHILKRLIFAEVGSQKIRYIDEIMNQIRYRAKLVRNDTVFDIKFKNGILRNGVFIGVEYTDFTPYSIDINYYADATPVQVVDDYLNHLTKNDADYRNRLLEILGYTLITNKEFKRMIGKFFIFVGDGENGKGTLLSIIRTILNNRNCTGLSIKNMTDARYFNTMIGKLANLGDDIEDMPISNEQMKQLKNVSTCDFVSTRQLYKESQEVEMTTTMIFTSNHILKSFEKSHSFKRRIVWLPMFSRVKGKSKRFISDLTTTAALEYWIKLIVEGYIRLYENEDFTESQIVNEFNENYHSDNNTVVQYLDDYDAEFFLDKRSPECFEHYEIWCAENGLNVQSRKLFVNTLAEIFNLKVGIKKVNGKTARVFQKMTNEDKR